MFFQLLDAMEALPCGHPLTRNLGSFGSPKQQPLRMFPSVPQPSAVHPRDTPHLLRRMKSCWLAMTWELFPCTLLSGPRQVKDTLFGWHGGVTLHARVYIHTQQICGISWSPDGEFFASGGNDNTCSLVETSKIIHAGEEDGDATDLGDGIVFGRASIKHQWRLSAAVKAIAFCPWQRGLLAVGGGSNDRCIHFYHTISGACLATIDCAAQVTSLTWSQTKREIAATFGFAQPEHPFRIAVYAWPSCQQVVAIPWQDEMRALYAIPYPRGPMTQSGNYQPGSRYSLSRTHEEGCLVVAASDGSIKFHEIWCEAKAATGPQQGLFGGSAILESLHGIDQESAETIR